MGDFKQDRGRRSGGGYGGRPSFSRNSQGGSGGRDRGPVTMHQAVCDQCGKPCEVPFRPTEGKPVYCNACFGGKKETGNNRRGDKYPQKSSNSYKTHAKTDFGGNISKGNNNELKKQLEILNVKMDQLIKAVEAITSIKPFVAEKKVKKVVKKAPVVKAKKPVKKVSKKTKK